jgi:hypothetical protein
MIRITIAVGLLSLRLQIAKRHARRAYVGRHWPSTIGAIA